MGAVPMPRSLTSVSWSWASWMGPQVFLTLIQWEVMTGTCQTSLWQMMPLPSGLGYWSLSLAETLNDQQCIFNYRLSRARWVVENVFRMLVFHFRCLMTTMAQEPYNVTSEVLACVTLHNIIRTCYQMDHQGRADEDDSNHRQVPGAWRQGQVLPDLGELQ